MSKKLTVSFSPHIQDHMTLRSMTVETIGALCPAILVGLYFYGLRAVMIVVLSVIAAVAAEAGLARIMKKPSTISDGTAVLTGLLLAMLLPVGVPWWTVIIGAAVAIFLGRQIFGGYGGNPFNAVLVGYLILALSWPAAVETFYAPANIFQGLSPLFPLDASELPLGLLTYGDQGRVLEFYPLGLALIGGIPGGIGSTSVIALFLGGIYLLVRRIIPWQIPVGYLIGVFVFALIAWLADPSGIKYANPFYHVIFGYTIIGAFFIAPDYTTSPYTLPGMIIFGLGAGALTMIIRYWGAYQDGVFFAILFFNALTPVLDRIRFKSYGMAKVSS
jgi:Na+-translocating ferredoxin:NAD+ oxidoreductase subunit D